MGFLDKLFGKREKEKRSAVLPEHAVIVHFQYGTTSCSADPAACTDVPVDAGSAEGDQTRSTHLTGLTPGVQYHFLVVASSALGGAEDLAAHVEAVRVRVDP